MGKTLLAVGLVVAPFSAAFAQAASQAADASAARAPAPTETPAPAAAPEPIATPQSAPAEAPAAASAAAAPQAKIIMYRSSSVIGAGLACPIRYQGKEIVELARGKYAEWPVNPGHYILTNKTSSVDVTVNPGETSYVRCMIKPGFMVGRADLQIVDEASYSQHAKDFEKKPIEQ
jgi:hypothetical protein